MPEVIATQTSAERGKILAAMSAILVVALAAYHNTFSVPELLDDSTAISSNRSIQSLWPIWAPLSPPATAGVGGRPFANLTFALNYWWGGLDLRGYHLINLLIHAGAGLALFGVARRTLLKLQGGATTWARDSTTLALAIAVLWTAHPVLTTSVTYLSQRTESLMGACYLLTLYAFIRGTESSAARRWFFISGAACFAGMATKEVMASAPVIVLLFDRTFVAGSFRQALASRKGYYACLAASWLLLAGLMTTGLNERNVGFGLGVEWWRYALTECRAVLIYARIGVWPHPLIFDYGPDFLSWGAALPFLAMVLLLLGGTIQALRRRPVVGFFAACPFLLLAPTSSVVPVTLQPIAENRIYLPVAVLVTALTLGWYAVAGRRGLAALIAVAVAFAWLSARRNEDYRSMLRLWADTVQKRPENPRAYDNYALALQHSGRREEAIAQFNKALELNPRSHTTLGLLGNLYGELGRLEEAIAHYRRSLELKPDAAFFHNNLGTALVRVNRRDEARWHFAEASRLSPGLASARANLATLLYQEGRTAEAAEQYRQALELDPDNSITRYNMGLMLFLLDRNHEALEHLRKAVEQSPNDANQRNTYGVALMRAGRLHEAESQLAQALRLNPQHPDVRSNLEDVRAALANERRGPGAPP